MPEPEDAYDRAARFERERVADERAEDDAIAPYREFVARWRKIIDGSSKSAEPWAVQFEEEAAALLDGPA